MSVFLIREVSADGVELKEEKLNNSNEVKILGKNGIVGYTISRKEAEKYPAKILNGTKVRVVPIAKLKPIQVEKEKTSDVSRMTRDNYKKATKTMLKKRKSTKKWSDNI